MKSDDASRRNLVRVAVEHGILIDAIVVRLIGDQRPDDASAWLVAASRFELDQLRALDAGGTIAADACRYALAHLARLEGVLALALEACAKSARLIAHHLAVAEEFGRDAMPGRMTSAGAVALGDRLAEYGRALARL